MGLFSGKLDTGVHIRVNNKVWKIIKIMFHPQESCFLFPFDEFFFGKKFCVPNIEISACTCIPVLGHEI